MKAIPALVSGLVLVAGAFAQDREYLAEAFSSEQVLRETDAIQHAPAVLVLDAPLRQELLKRWRAATPESATTARMKGLLLEDAGDPQAGEWLKTFPGDRVRLLWRAGKSDEAKALWLEAKNDLLPQAAAAMLPVVARGDLAERTSFRDFLLEPLAPGEVVTLCEAEGLTPAKMKDPEARLAWAKRFPRPPMDTSDLPQAYRLAVTVQGETLTREQAGEIRSFLKDPAIPAAGREVLIDALVSRSQSYFPGELLDLSLCDWIEAHAGEVVPAILKHGERNDYAFASRCGLAGILHLRSFLEATPEHRMARLALAKALRGFGGSMDEVMAQWEQCVDPSMAAPAGLPPDKSHSIREATEDVSVATAAILMAADYPERFRRAWFGKWRNATPRPAAEVARMAAWLCLDDVFWEAWPEAAADPAMAMFLLECVVRKRVHSGTYQCRKALEDLFAKLEDPPLHLRSRLRMPYLSAPLTDWRAGKSPAEIEKFIRETRIRLLQTVLANALAVEHPFRRFTGFPSNQSPPLLWGYQALPLFVRNGESHFRDQEIRSKDVAANMATWFEFADKGRLSQRSQRSMEAKRLAAVSDPVLAAAFVSQLHEWWKKDRDPDAGRILLDITMLRPDLPPMEPKVTGREVAAVLLAHERMVYPWARSGSDDSPARGEEAFGKGSDWMELRKSENPADLSYLAAAARAQVVLGRDENPLLWNVDEDGQPSPAMLDAVDQGLAALEKRDASVADRALCFYRISRPSNRKLLGLELAETGRLTESLARDHFAVHLKNEDIEGLTRCLDYLSENNAALTFKLLSQPGVLAKLPPAKLDDWLSRALPIWWYGEDPDKSSIPAFIGMLQTAGHEDAAVRVAMASCNNGCGLVPKLIEILPPRHERLVLAAVWLTGRVWEAYPAATHPHPSPRPGGKLLDLKPEEWRELVRMLKEEPRWGVFGSQSPDGSNSHIALLVALIAAVESDANVIAGQCALDRKGMIQLFGDVPVTGFWDPAFYARLTHAAGEFAGNVPPGEDSSAVLKMLSRYSAESPVVVAAFRKHLTALGSIPSGLELRQALLCVELPTVLELARQTTGHRDPVASLRSAALVLREAGYGKEAWELLVPVWPEIEKRAKGELRALSIFLPMARAAGQDEVVKTLIGPSPNPDASGVMESVEWLQAREGRHPDPVRMQGRWKSEDANRYRLEWALAMVPGSKLAEAGTMELFREGPPDDRELVWSGEVRGEEGSLAIQMEEDPSSLQVVYRSKSGKTLDMIAYTTSTAPVYEAPAKGEAEGPFPGMGARACRFPGLLCETDLPARKLVVSAWIRGPELQGMSLKFEWLNEQGQVMYDTEQVIHCTERGWNLVRLSPPFQLTGDAKGVRRARISLMRQPGKAIEIAGLRVDLPQGGFTP